jgi:hypothetical protein
MFPFSSRREACKAFIFACGGAADKCDFADRGQFFAAADLFEPDEAKMLAAVLHSSQLLQNVVGAKRGHQYMLVDCTSSIASSVYTRWTLAVTHRWRMQPNGAYLQLVKRDANLDEMVADHHAGTPSEGDEQFIEFIQAFRVAWNSIIYKAKKGVKWLPTCPDFPDPLEQPARRQTRKRHSLERRTLSSGFGRALLGPTAAAPATINGKGGRKRKGKRETKTPPTRTKDDTATAMLAVKRAKKEAKKAQEASGKAVQAEQRIGGRAREATEAFVALCQLSAKGTESGVGLARVRGERQLTLARGREEQAGRDCAAAGSKVYAENILWASAMEKVKVMRARELEANANLVAVEAALFRIQSHMKLAASNKRRRMLEKRLQRRDGAIFRLRERAEDAELKAMVLEVEFEKVADLREECDDLRLKNATSHAKVAARARHQNCLGAVYVFYFYFLFFCVREEVQANCFYFVCIAVFSIIIHATTTPADCTLSNNI